MSKQRSAVRFDRVSSADQRDGFSLNAQETMGSKYAHERELKVVKSWSVDESASKENDRKYFFEMIEFVKQHKIQDVIFDKIDRACRGFKSAVLIEELIDDHGVKFHFTRECLVIDKYSPPSEKLRFYLGTMLGKYHIDNMKMEINKGLQARREAGFWNGRAPFGYKNIRSGSSNRAQVVPDEVTAPIVKEIFQLYATGNYPYSDLVDLIKSKLKDERVITKRLLETMLTNPFYFGEMRTSGKVIKGSHPPLVSKDLWDSCQKIKGLRSVGHHSTRKGVIEKALMGLMKCGECGHAVTGESHRKPSGRVYVHYRCANHSCSEKRKNTSETALFDQIANAFEPFAHFTPEAVRFFIDSIKDHLKDLDYYTQRASAELLEERKKIKDNISKIEKLHAEGVLSDAEFKEVMEIKDVALEENQIEIVACSAADLQTFKEGFRIIELFTKVHNFMKLDGNKLEKARLAKLVLSNPILKDRTLQYRYEKPFDVLLEMTSNEKWWS